MIVMDAALLKKAGKSRAVAAKKRAPKPDPARDRGGSFGIEESASLFPAEDSESCRQPSPRDVPDATHLLSGPSEATCPDCC
mmetsp:Transcript_15508/g.39703  ORF Transcript_15508/g.39703 Transcript_15508/m.39703 type:complete len:82 (-) Transcript_15508:70-315(-)